MNRDWLRREVRNMRLHLDNLDRVVDDKELSEIDTWEVVNVFALCIAGQAGSIAMEAKDRYDH